MPRRRLALEAILVLVLAGGEARAQTPRFVVDVTWEGPKSCFDPQSPPFALNGVPPATWQLRFDNGSQVKLVMGLALAASPSVDWCGYWQRSHK
jgi:hypothetical protein